MYDLGGFDETDARFLEEMIKIVMIRKLSDFFDFGFHRMGVFAGPGSQDVFLRICRILYVRCLVP